MKKAFALILSLCMVFALAGCAQKSAAPTPAPAAAPTETPAPTPEPTPEPTPTATPEPPPLMPELPAVHDEALSQILEATLSVYPGSAGSSLRAARVAAWLLDWGAVTELTDDEIYSAVGTWMDGQDSERLFLEVHKVHLQKSAIIRTQIFSESALAALCGIALKKLEPPAGGSFSWLSLRESWHSACPPAL